MQLFLNIWNILMWIAFIFFAIAGIIIMVVHFIRTASIKNYKDKYDYISKYEISRWTKSIGSFGLSIMALINLFYARLVAVEPTMFFIRLFVAFCIGSLFFYMFSLIIKYAYPATLNKKLKKLRYTPRRSPAGNKMQLLSEDEEDVHLDEGMQVEEDLFSVDYDVWVDTKTGHVHIEKYPGYLLAQKCKSCGFHTMKVVKEEIVNPPTNETTGQLLKHYQCSYCKTKKRKPFTIAKLSQDISSYKLPSEMHFKEDRKLTVKVEIMSTDGFNQAYEFHSLHDARKFMERMENEKTLEVD
jgi:hypothetical protein